MDKNNIIEDKSQITKEEDIKSVRNQKRSKKNYLIVSLIIVFLGVWEIASLIYTRTHSQVTNNVVSTPTPANGFSQTKVDVDFFNQLPPPTEGTIWSKPVAESETFYYYNAHRDIKQMTIGGYASTANGAFTPAQNKNNAIYQTLSLYQNKVNKNWTPDSANAANGPTGESLDYIQTKGHMQQVMQFSFNERFTDFSPQTQQCPCSYTYKVFLSKPFEIPK